MSKIVDQLVDAIVHGKSHSAQHMLQANQGLINGSLDGQGHTPLHLAIIHQRWDVVKWLVTHGADQERTDEEGLTPSGYLVYGKDLVLDGLAVPEGFRHQALYDAIIQEKEAAVRRILAEEPALVNASLILGGAGSFAHNQASGNTPLHIAAMNGKISMIPVLKELGANTDASNHDDRNDGGDLDLNQKKPALSERFWDYYGGLWVFAGTALVGLYWMGYFGLSQTFLNVISAAGVKAIAGTLLWTGVGLVAGIPLLMYGIFGAINRWGPDWTHLQEATRWGRLGSALAVAVAIALVAASAPVTWPMLLAVAVGVPLLAFVARWGGGVLHSRRTRGAGVGVTKNAANQNPIESDFERDGFTAPVLSPDEGGRHAHRTPTARQGWRFFSRGRRSTSEKGGQADHHAPGSDRHGSKGPDSRDG